MDGRLKQRMVGAAVIVALGVIFIPALLDESGREQQLIPVPDVPPQPAIPEPLAIPAEPIELQGLTSPAENEVSKAPAPAPESPSDSETKNENKPKVVAGADTGDLSAWVVQLGSFEKESNARKLTKKLKADGYAAFIQKVKSGGTFSHKVRVGPEMTQQRAELVRKRIAKKHAHEGVVMRYRGPQAN